MQLLPISLFILLLLLSTRLITAAPTPDDSLTPTSDYADNSNHYHPQNPIVATVDLWRSGGCASQICNHNFLVGLNGCTIVPRGCATSAKVTTASEGCDIKIWTDNRCSSQNNVITVKKEWGGIGNCEQPGPQIGSMSVNCRY